MVPGGVDNAAPFTRFSTSFCFAYLEIVLLLAVQVVHIWGGGGRRLGYTWCVTRHSGYPPPAVWNNPATCNAVYSLRPSLHHNPSVQIKERGTVVGEDRFASLVWRDTRATSSGPSRQHMAGAHKVVFCVSAWPWAQWGVLPTSRLTPDTTKDTFQPSLSFTASLLI